MAGRSTTIRPRDARRASGRPGRACTRPSAVGAIAALAAGDEPLVAVHLVGERRQQDSPIGACGLLRRRGPHDERHVVGQQRSCRQLERVDAARQIGRHRRARASAPSPRPRDRRSGSGRPRTRSGAERKSVVSSCQRRPVTAVAGAFTSVAARRSNLRSGAGSARACAVSSWASSARSKQNGSSSSPVEAALPSASPASMDRAAESASHPPASARAPVPDRERSDRRRRHSDTRTHRSRSSSSADAPRRRRRRMRTPSRRRSSTIARSASLQSSCSAPGGRARRPAHSPSVRHGPSSSITAHEPQRISWRRAVVGTVDRARHRRRAEPGTGRVRIAVAQPHQPYVERGSVAETISSDVSPGGGAPAVDVADQLPAGAVEDARHATTSPPAFRSVACVRGGGTSIAGLRSKKPTGFRWNPARSTGITGQSSGRGTCVRAEHVPQDDVGVGRSGGRPPSTPAGRLRRGAGTGSRRRDSARPRRTASPRGAGT